MYISLLTALFLAFVDTDALVKVGKLAARLKRQIPDRVRPGIRFLEIAEWLESEAKKRGFGFAFPVNISVDSVAAHHTPLASGSSVFEKGQLVKIDFGFHSDGWPIDTAISVDLGNHKKMLDAARSALDAAIETIKQRGPETTLSQIGAAIESEIKSAGFLPITNLTGHKMDRWTLHAGLSIQNFDAGSNTKLGEGLFAIEPFATSGDGRVKNGPNSSIFRLLSSRPQRLPQLRNLLKEIEHFRTFPFAARWLSAPQYLPMLVRQGALHNYPELVEVSGSPVSQFEDTVMITDKEVLVLTR